MFLACAANQKLPNYLRAYRKRSGLSQQDLAYAVKLSGKSEWCELERFRRQPSYRTAAACAKVFGVPASELFAGIDVSTRRETSRRLRTLKRRLAARVCSSERLRRRIVRKIEWLAERLGNLVLGLSLS